MERLETHPCVCRNAIHKHLIEEVFIEKGPNSVTFLESHRWSLKVSNQKFH